MGKPQPRGRRSIRIAATAAVFLLLAVPAAGEGDEDCLKCHADKAALRKALDLAKKDRPLEELLIDRKAYGRSVHAERGCGECHFDFDTQPHSEDAESATCGDCHEKQLEQHTESLHGQALERGDKYAPRCYDCHTKHEVQSNKVRTSPTATLNIPLLCGRCHHEGSEVSVKHDIPKHKILENYSLSMHGRGVFEQGLAVTAVCTSCHTSHFILPHTDKRSSVHRDNVSHTCTSVCHANIELVHDKKIEGRLWQEEPEKIPVCTECHLPHEGLKRKYGADRNVQPGLKDENCLGCHGWNPEQDPEGGGSTGSEPGRSKLFVDGVAHSRSMHKTTACAQCHTEVRVVPGQRPCSTIKSEVDCAICHAEVVREYQGSLHGRTREAGDLDAPTCLDCHDKHETLGKKNPTSPTYAANIPNLCGKCHREGAQAAVRIESEIPDIVGSYTDSIHGKGLLKSGLVVTATCVSCHTAHNERPPNDPKSSIHKDKVADTCGECHHGIEQEFKHSVHWPGNGNAGREGLPTCKDCHTSHTISRVDQGDFRTMMLDQCGRCHRKEAETYFDTFHGKVSRLGGERAAKCYDCHGTHNIYPPSSPKSTLHRDHVVETCGKCHTGSHRRFAGYLTHATHHDAKTYPWLFWTFWLMTGLLVGTLAFAFLHTGAWLVRLWLTREEWRKHRAAERAAPAKKLYRRFNKFQRSLHLMMLVAFFTLALTGMSLKFSYMGWAQGVSWLLGGFDSMSVLHRLGAILLFIVVVLHLRDVRRKRKAAGVTWRQLITGPDSIIFNRRDLRDFLGSIKWFFGIGPRPHYARYTYWEKFDYFAVFWGVIVIGMTGLTLWFPEVFTYIVPGWFINVATIIHSDEALLAVGFIFTVHFFNTHFRPDKFPMDPVIFTGRVTLEELKYDKPGEYEELVKTGKLDEHMVDPFPKPVERGAKIFGFTALFVGLLLIGLIVYAMLFGYR